jgi:hypothetical protein
MAEQKTSTLEQLERNVEAANGLLQEITARASQAREQNNVFLLDLYTELLRVVSPIVTRAFAHARRQERAAINKAHKALRKQAREAREAAKKAEQKGASPESKPAQAEA